MNGLAQIKVSLFFQFRWNAIDAIHVPFYLFAKKINAFLSEVKENKNANKKAEAQSREICGALLEMKGKLVPYMRLCSTQILNFSRSHVLFFTLLLPFILPKINFFVGKWENNVCFFT